jgi:hypothetical protein
MQAFGISLVCGEKRDFKLNSGQKRLLLYSLYSLWVMNILSGYTFFSALNTGSFAYHPTRYPAPLCLGGYVVAAGFLIALFLQIILPALKKKSKFPPLMALVPVVSIWAWLQPFCQPFAFQIWLVPLAHGAQYLYFAYSVESRGFDQIQPPSSQENRTVHIVAVSLCAILLGYVSFLFMPRILDSARLINNAAPNFFLLSFFSFISLHHYVVDSVVWHRDSRARELLREVAA